MSHQKLKCRLRIIHFAVAWKISLLPQLVGPDGNLEIQ